MEHQPLTLVPAYIANTSFNTYSRGGTPGLGYASIHEAMEQVVTRVQSAVAPTYTHLYLHDIDTMCHHFGVGDPNVLPLVLSIGTELARLSEALPDNARLVVSADHGLIDVPKGEQALLMVGDPLLELLVVPPTGDARMPIFHIRPDKRAAFEHAFEDRFGERMALIPTADVEGMEIFGPGQFSQTARRRFGDFIAIPLSPATLSYHPPNKPLGELYKAVHAGPVARHADRAARTCPPVLR